MRAAKRALPGASVVVLGARIEVNGRPYLLSKSVQAWLRNYDDRCTPMRTEPVPFSFELWVEDGVTVAAGSLVTEAA